MLGVASGDRPVELPAYGRFFEQRGGLFRSALMTIRRALRRRRQAVRAGASGRMAESPTRAASGWPSKLLVAQE